MPQNKAYVDTTILCDVLGLSGEDKAKKASSALARYNKTQTPVYGLKELRVGPLSSWVLAHNVLVAHNTIEEAIDRLSRITSFKPRQQTVALRAIIYSLTAALAASRREAASGQVSTVVDEKSELENFLCTFITVRWNRRRSLVDEIVQPLSCFIDGELQLTDRQLRFSNDTADCTSRATCGAAICLKDRKQDTEKIVRALRPPKKGVSNQKHETTRRRGALKNVLSKQAKEFPRRDCRALGDAYFCIMAPNDSDILTTNLSDFLPMAQELGKTVKSP